MFRRSVAAVVTSFVALKTLITLIVLVIVPATSFADPTTADVTIRKGVNQCPAAGWAMTNGGTLAVPGTFAPSNIWPATSGVGKALDKAATKLGSTSFTCTVTYDPDFQITDSCGIANVLTIKVKKCHL